MADGLSSNPLSPFSIQAFAPFVPIYLFMFWALRIRGASGFCLTGLLPNSCVSARFSPSQPTFRQRRPHLDRLALAEPSADRPEPDRLPHQHPLRSCGPPH